MCICASSSEIARVKSGGRSAADWERASGRDATELRLMIRAGLEPCTLFVLQVGSSGAFSSNISRAVRRTLTQSLGPG